MDDPEAAKQALAAMRGSRMQLAETTTPASRHLAFAAMMGSIVLTPALPLPLRIAVALGVVPAIVAVKRWDERRTGMFINGYRRGRTRWVVATILLVWLAFYAAASWFGYVQGVLWPVPLLALAATGCAYMGSIWWCRVFSREMAE